MQLPPKIAPVSAARCDLFAILACGLPRLLFKTAHGMMSGMLKGEENSAWIRSSGH
jgi:hypothetical protein